MKKQHMMAKGVILSFSLLGVALAQAAQPEPDPLVRDNSAFAWSLYHELAGTEGNLFLSPYSISTAFAMTYAGARGDTEKQMAAALRYSLGQEELHPAFARLESRLKKAQQGGILLSVANSLWPQKEYPFLDDYMKLIQRNYGVSITPVDYKQSTEAARQSINGWVADKTQSRIKDLIKPGILQSLTRLVLVNAIYFKGKWEHPFKAENTKDSPFHVTSEKTVQAPLMSRKLECRYASLPLLDIIELPYVGGGMSMMVLLPKRADGLRQLEGEMSADSLSRWTSELAKREVLVSLPRFKMTSEFRLDDALKAMGMIDAFRDDKANFAGMDGHTDWLYISAAIHKAFVEVNEEGTEAAAATAVVMSKRGMSAPPPVFRADHPFVFLIQENQTGSILFMGRICDPTKAGE
jgi:serpin B